MAPRHNIRVYPSIAWLAMAAVLVGCGARDGAARSDDPSGSQRAEGSRILVEVINTTSQRGLARRATFFLRDQGFDVVRYASGTPARDSSLVIDRSGHAERARRVAEALGVSRVQTAIDSARYLDVSVLLGRDWRPPAKPFYP